MTSRVRSLIGVGAVVAALFVHPLAGSASRQSLAYTDSLWQGLIARCGAAAATDKPYPWPLKPFHEQHPIRGFFGDPRALVSSVKEPLTPDSPGAFSFHNGVDIFAPANAKVFPVVSGRARVANAQEVVVRTRDGRTFQYWHVLPLVRTGSWVTASETVLGTAIPRRGHVHLTEIRGDCVVNPLAPGHLEPYHDPSQPEVVALNAIDADGVPLDLTQVAGPFGLVVQAQEMPPFPVPAPWQDLPVTPATVRWRLTTQSGGRVVVPWTFAADFAVTVPPPRDYWRVYADGTHQNFVGRGSPQEPGMYEFRLTPPRITLAPGRYTATVAVSTTGGNRSRQRFSFRVVSSSSAA